MKCVNCNEELPEGAAFCMKCGTKVDGKWVPKMISMRCSSCGGTLTTDADKEVLTCPYCGAKELVVENDNVKIEKIKAATNKEIELEKIRAEERKQNTEEKKAQTNKFRKGFFSKFIVICLVIDAIFAFMCFGTEHVAAGIIAVIQVICLGISWALGMQIIKEKKNYTHVLVAIFAMLLALPTLLLCTVGGGYKKEVVKDWDIFFIGDAISKPPSNKYEVLTNTENELNISVLKISSKEYYQYISDCKEVGYTLEIEEGSSSFEAFNEEGYYLDLFYSDYSEELSIHLNAPTLLQELNWSNHGVADIIPEPTSSSGKFETEDKDKTIVIVGETTTEQFSAYCQKCRDLGFVIEEENSNEEYHAFNREGFKLRVEFTSGNSEMKITLNNPMEFVETTWPQINVGSLLPVPPSLSGYVSSNYDWTYTVYIENMSRKDYEDYVQKCIEVGFDKDSSSYTDSYHADYSDDESISVSYEGFNIVKISIQGSLTKDYSTYRREDNSEPMSEITEETSMSEQKSETVSEKVSESTAEKSSEVLSEKESEKESDSEVVAPSTASKYERAFVKKNTQYSIYYMFDEDTNEVINFVTNDTGVMKGTYSGKFASGVDIDWSDYGYHEKFTCADGSKTAKLIDGNDFEWTYDVCDVETAQKALDNL